MRPLSLGPYQLRTARRLAGIALFFQWFIVVTGATVRLTGSGLGCPNWPSCTTARAIPALEQHALIEWANRMTATPTLLTALLACWACWRVCGPRRRDLRLLTTLVVAGVIVQAGIGALTVLLELPPEVVAVHFLVSIGLLAAATVAWHGTSSERELRPAGRRGARGAAAAAMLASLLAVIVAGVLTTASGPHSGAAGTGQQVDRFDMLHVAVTLHARGAWTFLCLVLLLTWLRARRGVALRDLGLLLTLVLVQVALGELQYRTGLPWQVVLAHVATAAALWVVAVRIAADALLAPVAAQPIERQMAPQPSDMVAR